MQSLHDQLSRAKDVNDAMWDTVVQQFVSQAKPSETNAVGSKVGEDGEDDQRRRKRGRT